MRFQGGIGDWQDDAGPAQRSRAACISANRGSRPTTSPTSGRRARYLHHGLRREGKVSRRASRVCGARRKFGFSSRARQLARQFRRAVLVGGRTLYAYSRTPLKIVGVHEVASVVTFFAYVFDKSDACKGGLQASESTLYLMSMLGGWRGALLGQHKTRTLSFQGPFLSSVAANLVAVHILLSCIAPDFYAMVWPGEGTMCVGRIVVHAPSSEAATGTTTIPHCSCQLTHRFPAATASCCRHDNSAQPARISIVSGTTTASRVACVALCYAVSIGSPDSLSSLAAAGSKSACWNWSISSRTACTSMR